MSNLRPEPPDIAYEHDFYAWAEHQADLVRRLRADGATLANALDIENIAEEIEALGRAELHAVESQILNILVHLLKAVSAPRSNALAHWRTEVVAFQIALMLRHSRSMDRRLELDRLWPRAVRLASAHLSEHGDTLPRALPASCPFQLDDFLSDEFDFDALVRKLGDSLLSVRATDH